MAEAAQEDEDVENSVIKRNSGKAVDDGAQGVSDASGNNPVQCRRGQVIHQWTSGENDHPSHGHIHQRGNQLIPPCEKKFKDHTQQRDAPYHCKKDPSGSPMEGHERKRGVGARNK